jgi:hypothetical protein
MEGIWRGPADRQIAAGEIVQQVAEVVEHLAGQWRRNEQTRPVGLRAGSFRLRVWLCAISSCHGGSIGAAQPVDSGSRAGLLYASWRNR